MDFCGVYDKIFNIICSGGTVKTVPPHLTIISIINVFLKIARRQTISCLCLPGAGCRPLLLAAYGAPACFAAGASHSVMSVSTWPGKMRFGFLPIVALFRS